jgi:hypothetical protein
MFTHKTARVLVAGAAVAVLAAGLVAGEPWKEKPFNEWTAEEISRLMTDSPWAKVVSVPATWKGGRANRGLSSDTSASSGAPTSISGTTGGEFGGAPSGARTAGPPPDRASPGVGEGKFLVRWASGRAMILALARLSMLKNDPPAEAERILRVQPQVHEVVIVGPDMSAFESIEIGELKERAYLKPRSAKDRVAPLAVQIRRSPDGKQVAAVIFDFPRATPDGKPLIASGEKGVEFGCAVGGATLKVSFDPQKMVTREGPEF